MDNTQQQPVKYHGFTIDPNEYGWFNVPAINCWSTPTMESAKRAIDRYAELCGLDENGVPRKVSRR